MIASLTCPARQSIRILSRTVKHLRTVHVQLFPRKTVSTMNKTYVFGKTSVFQGLHTRPLMFVKHSTACAVLGL